MNESPQLGVLSTQRKELFDLLLTKKGIATRAPRKAISRRHSEKTPLSYAQQRLWFMEQLDPGSATYNIPAAVRLQGRLNTVALSRSINEIVRRHEILRTVFPMLEGQPVQEIRAAKEQDLPLVDLSGLEEWEREEEARRLAEWEAARGFDLSEGPLMRTVLARLGKEDHLLIVTMHHIVSDGWSVGILVKEFATLYEAYSQGGKSPLPELELQYRDFAVWQREWLQDEVLEEQLNFWRKQLEGAEELELPMDLERPKVAIHEGRGERFELSEEVTSGLEELSRREGVTLFMMLLAAFQILLSRYSGQTDISVGTTIANRNRVETESLIGFFVNILVLRMTLDGDPPFTELLQRARHVTLGAFSHQDLPFDRLVEALQPTRYSARQSLFQATFELQNQPTESLRLSELEISYLESETSAVTFDLSLALFQAGERLCGMIEYDVSRFSRVWVRRMSRHLQNLLLNIIKNPDARISALSILTPQEIELLRAWNATSQEFDLSRKAHELFEAQASQKSDAVAIVNGSHRTTYGELNRRSNQLAHYLRGIGISPGIRVGIWGAERSSEVITGMLGVLKAGGAYVPIDATQPNHRRNFMLKDAAVQAALIHKAFGKEAIQLQVPTFDLESDWDKIADYPSENLLPWDKADWLAYVIYTSGSTGTPKGVMISHHSLINAYWGWQQAYELDSVCTTHLQMAGFAFDVFTGDWVRALCTGAQLVICAREQLLSPSDLYALMSEERVDCGEFVPTILTSLIGYLEATDKNLDFMRLLVAGSEVWHGEYYKRIKEKCDNSARIINSYGLTETTIDSSYFEQTECDIEVWRSMPIGRPFANTQIYALDRNLEQTAPGVAGELYIGGAGVGWAYLNQPGLTAERFLPNPFGLDPGARLYKTGDIGRYCEDGNIEFVKRRDSQIKIRGRRIELGEIEAVVRRSDFVQDCVVLDREHAAGEKFLCAYVVLKQSGTTSLVREYTSNYLPSYMTPQVFVALEKLPLSPNGKLDRDALPAPEVGRLERPQMGTRTAIEDILCGVWEEVLKVERIEIDDNFFELGGHSLLATQVVSQVRRALSVELPLRVLFESSTVRELAREVEKLREQGRAVTAPPIVRVPRNAMLPLSYAQERLWFIHQLEPDNPAYNMALALRLLGPLNTRALTQSLQEIARRHEALRTRFVMRDGLPMQAIDEPAEIALPVYDLSSLDEASREPAAQEIVERESQRPFNLEREPVWRAELVRIGEEEHVLFVCLHHVASDGWSADVMVKEFSVLYEAYRGGRPSPLPELSIQYADYALWQREWLRGPVLEEQLNYWRKQLAGVKDMVLPMDRVNSAAGYRIMDLGFKLPSKLADDIQRLSRQEGMTLFMTLLTAFKVALSYWAGRQDVVIGTDVANRNRLETEDLIGFFVNQVVLRTDLTGNPRVREALRRVRETTLGAYAHQDIPFQKLVEDLQPNRDQGQTPFFQVIFVLNNTSAESVDLPKLSSLIVQPFSFEFSATKFNLVAVMQETEDGILGTWKYNTQFFDPAAITRLRGLFQTLLERFVDSPDIRIKELEKAAYLSGALSEHPHRSQSFRKIRPKTVTLTSRDIVNTSHISTDSALPIVLTPAVGDLDAIEWAEAERQFIELNLEKYGAILFRGFKLDGVEEFEKFTSAICPELFTGYSDLPREHVGTKVYGSTPYPNDQAIGFHNESSHLHCWPLKIWFYCLTAPPKGGETPIVDCRRLYQEMDPELRQVFRDKGLMYVRNFKAGLDVSWQDFFKTSDPAVVEEFCRKAGILYEWGEGNTLRTKRRCQAITTHPRTGQSVFFNQLQAHHISCLDPAAHRDLLSLFGEEGLPRNVYYGDGEAIPAQVVAELRDLYERRAESFTWQEGDILMVDNMLVAHGRRPFTGPRKIVVAMGEMVHSNR